MENQRKLEKELMGAGGGAGGAGGEEVLFERFRAMAKVRSVQKFFTHRSVSTFDRVPFQLTDELFFVLLEWPSERSSRVRRDALPVSRGEE